MGGHLPEPLLYHRSLFVLFLLKNDEGRGLLIAQSGSKDQADRFGREYLPEFCGESIEIESESQAGAEEFWGVRTVRLVNVLLDPTRKPRRDKMAKRPAALNTITWVYGPELPSDVEEDGLLTIEDRRDLTLDHMARASTLIVQLQITKWS